MRRLILAWQPHIRVLEPEHLRLSVVQALRLGMAGNWKGGVTSPSQRHPGRLRVPVLQPYRQF